MTPSPEHQLRQLLRRYRRALAAEQLKSGLLAGLLFVLVVAGLAVTAESLWYFSPAVRRTLLWVGGGALAFYLFSLGLWLGILTSGGLPAYTDFALAKRLGAAFPDLGDGLVNALALLSERNDYGYSSDLIRVNLRQVAQQAQAIDPEQAVSGRSRRKLTRASMAVAGLWILIGLPFAHPSLGSAYRLLHPNQAFDIPRPFEFRVTPGNTQVLDNKAVTIAAGVTGEQPDRVLLTMKSGEDRQTYPLTAEADGQFRHTLEELHRSFSYYVHAPSSRWWDRRGDIASPTYQVHVVSRPQVQSLTIRLKPPAYSGLPDREQEVTSTEISALKGTRVQLFAQTSKPVQSAALVFEDQKQDHSMAVSGTDLQAEFPLLAQDQFSIHLTDFQAVENTNPAVYRLVPLTDEPPRADIVQPEGDVDLGDALQIPLVLNLQDDYGFSRLAIQYQIQKPAALDRDSTWQSIRLSLENPAERAQEYHHLWDLNRLNLSPRDVVRYRIAVWDNDTVSGPKVGYSGTRMARFPSLGDMFARARQQQETSQSEARDVAEQVERIKQQVDQLTLEFQKKETVSWQQKQQAEAVIKSHEEFKKQLDEISQHLDQLQQMAEKHQLFSDDVMKKMQQLQQMFRDVMTPELEKALQDLQKSLDDMDPQAVQQAMENLQVSEKNLSQSIDRALELFKRVKIEQQTDELVKRVQDLVKQQSKINQQADSSAARPEQLGQQEQLAADEYDITEQRMQELADLMQEFPNLPSDEMRQNVSRAQSDSIGPNMRRAQQSFQQQRMQQAQQSGQQAQAALQQLSDRLQQTQQLQQQQMMAEVMDEFRSVLRNALSLSQQQEALQKQTRTLENNSPQLGDLADRQQSVQINLQHLVSQIVGLSQKTFGVTRDIGKALGQSASNMQQSVQSLAQRQAKRSSEYQGEAMTSLNETAQQLIAAMNSLQSQGSSTGYQDFLKQMEELTRQQKGLNQQSSQFGMNGQPSLAERAAMQRLASRQSGLRQTLRQIQEALQKSGGRQGLGDMEGIGKDMEEVTKDLRQGQYQRKTAQRQQQIMSRLLDAQKSIRTRDYSKERESETGEAVARSGPAGLPADRGERRNVLREDLDRALREGYGQNYQELIRAYFEQLSQETREAGTANE